MNNLKMAIDDFKKRKEKSRIEDDKNNIGRNYKHFMHFNALRDIVLICLYLAYLFIDFSPVTIGQTIRIIALGDLTNENLTFVNMLLMSSFLFSFYVLFKIFLLYDYSKIKNIEEEELQDLLTYHLDFNLVFAKAMEEYQIIIQNFKIAHQKKDEEELKNFTTSLNKEDLLDFESLERIADIKK